MRFIRLICTSMILPALLGVAVPSRAPAADPPARIGRVSYLSGSVSFRAGAGADWDAATLNYPVTTGDELWSPADARAEVHVGSSAVRLGPETRVDFLDVSDRSTRLRLTRGSLYVRVRALGTGETYDVATPSGAISLRDPGHYRIDLSPSGRATTITTRDGSAEISTASGASVSVPRGETVAVTGSSSSVVTTVAVDGWETWCDARDRRDDGSISLRHVSPEWVGFEDLDDYGVWEADPGLGPVWVPRVSAAWAPYRFGSWASVGPWGWTWIDDAPWGFAPFHYGRWAFRRGGWAWVPGEAVAFPVYAPALVAFVGGSGFDLSLDVGSGGLAWFPLAPGEVYLPAYRVSRTYVRDVNITSVKVRQLDVTRIDVTRIRYANRTVPGAVTAVSKQTFLGGRDVAKAAVRVPPSAVAKAAVVGMSAPVGPASEPRAGRAAGRQIAEPPAMAATRPSVGIRTQAGPTTPAGRTGASAAAPRRGPADDGRPRQRRADRDEAVTGQAAERAELERRHAEEPQTTDHRHRPERS